MVVLSLRPVEGAAEMAAAEMDAPEEAGVVVAPAAGWKARPRPRARAAVAPSLVRSLPLLVFCIFNPFLVGLVVCNEFCWWETVGVGVNFGVGGQVR
ncbi:hypothetical protein Aros01_00933 [Streptosporangium roseum]